VFFMTKMIAALGNAPLTAIQAPTGRWYLAGTGPAFVMIERRDGAPLTARDAEIAAQCGARIAGCRTRTYDTRELAEAAITLAAKGL
jgi:hypothetical protein